jgi:hypothetical protein
MKRIFTVCAALSLSCVSAAWAQDMPAGYQQVRTRLGKQGDETPTPGPVEKLALGFKATLDRLRTPKSTAAKD